MKADQIRELSVDEIRARLGELEEERFRLRFRGATEALTNVSKHAGVSEAMLLVHHDANGVNLMVVDSGTGGDWEAASGFGLAQASSGLAGNTL